MVFNSQFVISLVKNIFPSLRKTQVTNLALGVFGQTRSQSTIMSEIVREVPGAVKHKHRLKRLWRFVSNGRVKPERLFALWVPWCVKKFSVGRYLQIALDWTTLQGNIQYLTASLLFRGRAIPVIWQIVAYAEIKDSQNRIEERLITRLVNLIPAGKRPVIMADRGFGRADFLTFLQDKGVLFAIRVKSDVRVTPQKGKPFLLTTLAKKLKPDMPIWYGNISYRDDGAVSNIHLAAVVTVGSDDPWFIVTNLRSVKSAVNHYASRFQIEEGFKDAKHPLGLDRIQTRNLTRIRRMVLVTAISQALLLLIGQLAWKMKRVKQQVISTASNTCSRLWLGIQIVCHRLLGQPFWTRVRLAACSP